MSDRPAETSPSPGYVLLTGATGALGQVLLRSLLSANCQTAVLVRPSRSQTAFHRIDGLVERWEHESERTLPRPMVISGDLLLPELGIDDRDREWVRKNCSSVLHCAASLQFYADTRNEPYESNVAGTQRLIDLAKSAQIPQFTYISTSYVVGHGQTEFRDSIDLDSPLHDNDYERSKWAAEQLVLAASHLKSRTIVRPSIIVGDSRTGALSDFQAVYTPLKLAAFLLKNPGSRDKYRDHQFDPIHTLGLTGLELKNLVPVDWVASTTLEIHNRPELHGHAYFLTNPQPVSTGDITAAMVDVFFADARRSKSESAIGIQHQAPETTMGEVATPPPSAQIAQAIANEFGNGMQTYRAYFCNDPRFISERLAAIPSLPKCPTIDVAFLKRTFQYALNVGFTKHRSTTLAAPRLAERNLPHMANSAPSQNDSAVPSKICRIVQTGVGGGTWIVTQTASGTISIEADNVQINGITVRVSTVEMNRLAAGTVGFAELLAQGRVAVFGSGSESLSTVLSAGKLLESLLHQPSRPMPAPPQLVTQRNRRFKR